MARNRKRNYRKNVSYRVFPGWLAVVLFVAGTLALSYLWLDARCNALGRRIKSLEQQKVALQRQVANEEFKWSNLTTFENMVKLLQQHNLVMEWPKEKSVVRVRRPESVALDRKAARNLAQN
jgi:hypothetical protein